MFLFTSKLQESIIDGLGRTDVRAIDDGLRGLSSSVEVAIGLMSFSDDEDDDDDSVDSGKIGAHDLLARLLVRPLVCLLACCLNSGRHHPKDAL